MLTCKVFKTQYTNASSKQKQQMEAYGQEESASFGLLSNT